MNTDRHGLTNLVEFVFESQVTVEFPEVPTVPCAVRYFKHPRVLVENFTPNGTFRVVRLQISLR